MYSIRIITLNQKGNAPLLDISQRNHQECCLLKLLIALLYCYSTLCIAKLILEELVLFNYSPKINYLFFLLQLIGYFGDF